MRRYLMPALALLAGGCAMTPDERWDIPPGSTVTINRPITIGVDSASVRIQDGRPTSFQSINMYTTFCILEVREPRPAPQVVNPGRFTVTKYVQRESFSSLAPGAVAGVGVGFGGGFGGNGSPINYVSDIYLASPEQPDVFRLSCQQYSFPAQTMHYERWSTVAQMRIALGDLISITITPRASGG